MAHDLEKKWRSKDVQLREDVDFSALLLSKRVIYGLKKGGFKKPSPIQLEAIPLSKVGKDLLVQAKSGTGKTLVFVITALEMLRHTLHRPQVMILVPTREIATQICSVIKSVGAGFPKLTCCSFIGGLSVSDDMEKAQTCQIVVGTPGRINHLINEKCLPTSSIRFLVFDEADRLLNLSFKNDMNSIFNALPEDKQVIATSATYPEKLKKLLLKYLREPHIACLNSREIALLGMIHYVKVIKNSPMPMIQYRQKIAALEEILKGVKFSQCLVFCNGIQKVDVVYKDIKKWGFSAAHISSANEQEDRLKAIDRLRHFKCKVLVSSDVTARGIDAENVDLVVNFDFAFGTETYMHRAGRAGRYGSVGVNISIMEEKDMIYLKRMEVEGAFKAYKLPDPLPVDLIQSRSTGEYVIEENAPEELDSDEYAAVLDEIKASISVDNENNRIEKESAESVGKNDISSGDSNSVSANESTTEKVLDETGICLSLSKSELLCNGTNTVPSENSVNVEVEDGLPVKEDNQENVDENFCDSSTQNVSRSVNIANMQNISSLKSVKITCLGGDDEKELPVKKDNEEKVSKNFRNSSTQELSDEKNTDENLSKSNIQNVPQSVPKEVLEAPVSAKIQTVLNGTVRDGRTHDIMDKECVNHSLEGNKVETCDEKLYESTSMPCEFLDVRNCTENVDINDVFTNDIFVRDNLNESDLDSIIKTFLTEYELDKNMKSSDPEDEKDSVDDNGEKTISICAINNLNSKKYAYIYEVCKKYQDEQNRESGENVNRISNVISLDQMCEQNAPSSDVTCDGNNSASNEQSHANSVERSEENVKCEDGSLKPTKSLNSELDADYKISEAVEESIKKGEDSTETLKMHEPVGTPECELSSNGRISSAVAEHHKNADIPVGKFNCESTPAKQCGFQSLFNEQVTSESESNYMESAEEDNLHGSEFSSSSSSSEDSEEESDSDSSEFSLSGSSYHHNKSRSGKQNPSLVSSSSSSDGSEEQNERRYGQNPNSFTEYPHCDSFRPHQPNHYYSFWKNNPHHSHAASSSRRHKAVPRHVCGTHSHPGHSQFSEQHSRCFQPSKHRCHCDSACNQMPVCSQWHQTFYSQWNHLQNCMNSVMYH